ncbi:hypothetical protein FB45DRAFT_1025499 [Roridomyces roridus]|uniref:DUF6533 domain-containing protein n=1 Tax=Roridomyces roridus TaxID=1738132 RepID=A0AAD7FNI1_9AGAR|nr:hypothetical protein FB45DRAFT_1025499 [Roridomyces roridus]
MESLATAFMHLRNNYMFATACYVLYIYDHILTFPAEVDKIWSQPLTLASTLFYLNRYVTHGQFIVLQVAFFETQWSVETCEKYVLFPGAATMSLVAITCPFGNSPLTSHSVTLILRVYALYLSNKYVLSFLLAVLSAQIVLMGWALHFGIRVPLPPGFPGCVLTGNNDWFGAFWAAPIATDTLIFLLTLWRTLRYQREHGRMNYMHILLRDGVMYFMIIFSVNLVNCIIYFSAVQDMKAAGASFSQIMTAIMISRLHLNLRRGSSRAVVTSELPMMSFATRAGYSSRRTSKTIGGDTTFFSVGNLGGEMEGTIFDVDNNDDTKSAKFSDGKHSRAPSDAIELTRVV